MRGENARHNELPGGSGSTRDHRSTPKKPISKHPWFDFLHSSKAHPQCACFLQELPRSEHDPNSIRSPPTTSNNSNCEFAQLPLQNTLPLCSRKSNGTKVFHEVTPDAVIGPGERARWHFQDAYIPRSKQLPLAAQR